MKAVQLDAPGPPQALHLRDLPMPQPSAGWVRIRVEAFGLNRSELHLRLGLAEGVTFPRVPSVGLAAAALAREMGATVLATTRQRERLTSLAERGIEHPILDGGQIAPQVRALFPEGVDATLELVGTPTLKDSLRATRVHGTVCSTGMVSNQWIVPDFYPIGYIPSGVRLTGYGGDAGDLPQAALQRYLDAVAAGRFSVPIHQIYELEQIQEAHATMEKNQAVGKLVVRVRHPS
jgi:NADPH:quinone reductase-like Zn-dependent oxidoreductase